MASLFVIQGPDQGRRYEVGGSALTLGRDRSNAVQLHDTEVSRRHAELRRQDGRFWLADLKSSNGSYVNSERIEQQALRSGDRVQLGRTLLLFTDTQEQSHHELSHEVDIVGAAPDHAGSRIVRSLSQEDGSQVLVPSQESDSPWLARARSNLQIMYRTALAVSHTLDIDQLLSRILELIFEWVEADRGCIMLVDPETSELAPRATRSRRGPESGERLSISRTILDYVTERKEGVLTSDAQDDQRWDPDGSIVTLGVREAICTPMQGRYSNVGVIYIDTFTPPGRALTQRTHSRFTEEHLKLMIAIAHQAALAVEDTSYYSALVQAERLAAMGQTIATLSHHIKNILQGVRGGSYLIDEGLKSSDQEVIRKGWKIVERNQERISNLVLDMLTFSKDRRPELVPADMNQVAGDVVELMHTRAAELGVALEWTPEAGLPELTFDPEGLHRAILNVVTNALDACAKVEGGRVAVSTEYDPAAGRLRVIVEDNGEGIPPEDVQRIFSMFESTKGARGTGLGLPVSQKILREHGGDLTVASEPGVGSRFVLDLPATLPESAPPAALETLRGREG